MTTAKLIGVNSDTSVCECCGKTNLKSVSVIELENGTIVRYGKDCAAKKLGKSFKAQIELVGSVSEYIAKWSSKYTGEIIVKGIWNKFGMSVEYKSGQYHFNGGLVI